MKRPGEILIQQAREEIEDESYLPSRLSKAGISAAVAATFSNHPFFAQMLTSLILNSSRRANERIVAIAEELEAQHARIEDQIKDKSFYESAEFQTLLLLAIERIHTMHEQKKLKQFGVALANSALPDYTYEEKEAFIHTLRDLSVHDFETLKDDRLRGWLPTIASIEYGAEVLSSLSRLNAMGLVMEQFHPPRMNFTTGSDRLDSQMYLKEFLRIPREGHFTYRRSDNDS